MAEKGFPKKVEDVVMTLLEIYRHQGRSEIIELLENSSARIEQTGYDNWNGGIFLYTLILDIPVPIFAAIEPQLAEIEREISSKLTIICRDLAVDYLNSVNVTPLLSKLPNGGYKTKPADSEVKHIWKPGFFRLFLSHVSSHKVAVTKLKNELLLRGISAFVAHEDIAPSLEWQHEIELALGSMHALAALLTPDFHLSNWTDQEIGFALGRGVHVVPVRLGVDPYGFIGKLQGVTGSLNQPDRIASQISNILLNHRLTHQNMQKGIVFAFQVAASYANAIELSRMIAKVKDFTEDEKTMIRRACEENSQIFRATGVVSRIRSAIGAPEQSKVTSGNDFSF